MADQEALDKFKGILENPEAKEAYLFEGAIYFKREYRDARELQTRMTYHMLETDGTPSEDNFITMKTWATVRKAGEKVK